MKIDFEKYDIAGQSKKDFLRLLHVYQQAIDLNIICSITDSKGVIIYVNQKFCEISKYSKKELIGQNHRILNSGFHTKDFFENMWNTIKRGNIWQGEVKNKAKDGSFFWLDNTIFPVLDKRKKIVQYFSMRLIIDLKKEVEEERIGYIKSLEEMIFMTSHQVRLPIVNLLGLANQLEDATNSKEEVIKIIACIKESATALDKFTKELTSYMSSVNNKEKEKTTIKAIS
ncbi:MAG: PAS domain S-box protein [Flavobacterium sp.]|nr:PAS domain S-box protein [Flavobacterium sp.]